MTEVEWLTTTDPLAMCGILKKVEDVRKWRLLACGCARRLWPYLVDERLRNLIETAEQYADDLIDGEEFTEAKDLAFSSDEAQVNEIADRARSSVYCACLLGARHGALGVFQCVIQAVEAGALVGVTKEKVVQAQAIRDIFGNPFRPHVFNPAWRTSTSVTLATQMYDSRDFSAMPILADALEDAGCEDAEVLGHCREGGPHVKGCWVVDLVLDRK